jgi:uncharacterized protein involved in type VI secretion and phage assembly
MTEFDALLWEPRGNDFGVALATVDETNDPRGLGRIRVRFELKRDGEGHQVRSDWLQVASPFAGGQYGMFFLPQKGASALVAFSGSDPACAYVIGFLWNGQLKPPVEREQQADVRVIKTKNGKQITIDDSEGGGIKIIDEKNNVVHIDSEKNQIEMRCSGGTYVNLSNDGGVSVKATGNVSIQATGLLSIGAEDVSIEAKSRMTLKAMDISLN